MQHDAEVAPVWLGEFGTADDNLWWKHLLRYLHEREVDFSYWSFNGQKSELDNPELFGLMLQDAVTPRQAWKIEDLWALVSSAPAQPIAVYDIYSSHLTGRRQDLAVAAVILLVASGMIGVAVREHAKQTVHCTGDPTHWLPLLLRNMCSLTCLRRRGARAKSGEGFIRL
jgi:hypothetical protein